MNYRNRQAGGTILGIIIGLIIGLGIAVGVAMTINKVPAPFVNRNARTEKPAETAPSQSVDLNKSLYGNREPAKEAAKEFVKEAEPAADAKTGDKATDKAADKTAADKNKKTDADAKSADAKAADKDAAGDDKWTYYLQAGAFREQADAENTKAKLALLGFETRINERTVDTGTMYRVRVGPFSQVEAMNKVRSKLSDNGVDVSVVRIPK